MHLEPSPLPSGGDLVRCLVFQAGKWCSIFPGFPQSPRRRQYSFRGGCTESESALPNSSWKALKGSSSSWSYDASPVEMSAHPGMAAMPRARPCHSPVPSHKEKSQRDKPCCDLPGHPPPELSLLNSPLMCLVFTAAKSCLMFAPFAL